MVQTHIDHIYHTDLSPLKLTSVGSTDHPHILEKTDHFPIWIGLRWNAKVGCKAKQKIYTLKYHTEWSEINIS
jgi:hypothetical protein